MKPGLISPRYRILILLIVGFLVYLPSLGNSFVWDDEEQILNNTFVHSVQNIPHLLGGSTFGSGGAGQLTGMYYKPLMPVTFSVLYSLFGAHAWPFHLLQMLLHAGNAVLLYLVLKKLFGAGEKGQWRAWCAAVIFTVHPLQVETVVYISALQDALYFFFGILALWLWSSSPKPEWWRYILAGLLLLLSLLSKETGIIFSLILLIYVLLWQRKVETIQGMGTVLFFVYMLYGLLRFGVAGIGLVEGDSPSPIMRAEVWQRLLSTPKIIGYYLVNLIWPHKLSVAQHWVVSEGSVTELWLPLGLIVAVGAVIVLLGAAVWHKSDLKRLYLFFVSWFGLGMIVHVQLVPLDMTVADRWFYPAMAGLLGLAAVAALRWNKVSMRQAAVMFAVVTVLLSVRSVVRVTNWKNNLTLFGHDSQYTQAFDLDNNLGVAWYREGDIDKAQYYFERSTQVAPYWWSNWNNLGAVMQQRGDMHKAKEYYAKAIGNNQYYLAYENYAKVLYHERDYQELDRFLKEKALPVFPYNQTLVYLWRYLKEMEASTSAEVVQ